MPAWWWNPRQLTGTNDYETFGGGGLQLGRQFKSGEKLHISQDIRGRYFLTRWKLVLGYKHVRNKVLGKVKNWTRSCTAISGNGTSSLSATVPTYTKSKHYSRTDSNSLPDTFLWDSEFLCEPDEHGEGEKCFAIRKVWDELKMTCSVLPSKGLNTASLCMPTVSSVLKMSLSTTCSSVSQWRHRFIHSTAIHKEYSRQNYVYINHQRKLAGKSLAML